MRHRVELRLYRLLWVIGVGLGAALCCYSFGYLFGYEVLLYELASIVCGFLFLPFSGWFERKRPKTPTKTLSFSNDSWRNLEGTEKDADADER